jgi:hypothetical protein
MNPNEKMIHWSMVHSQLADAAKRLCLMLEEFSPQTLQHWGIRNDMAICRVLVEAVREELSGQRYTVLPEQTSVGGAA